MLVIAGPGSGKTTVAIHRIYNLISCCGVHPENILAISFTNAAADEMRDRFLKLTNGEGSEVTFGTFHSVYFRILKYAYHYDASQIIGDEGRMRFLAEELSDLEPAMAEEPPEGSRNCTQRALRSRMRPMTPPSVMPDCWWML